MPPSLDSGVRVCSPRRLEWIDELQTELGQRGTVTERRVERVQIVECGSHVTDR